MRLISTAVIATALMSGAAQAHTANTDAEAASTLLMLVAYAGQPGAPGEVRYGDLSRSPEQIRRTRLAAMRRQPDTGFRLAAQKPPM